jgi:RNA recognition motif-containing protein
MNIYVGNLSYDATDDELQELFAEFGEVSSASVIQDRESGRSRGFGFVEMPNDAEAQAAINALNGRDVQGRSLRVNEARPREERPRGNGGFRSSGNQRGGGGRRSW